MGRGAVAVCHWRGTSAQTRLLLESHELILRGVIRATIDRASIRGLTVAEGRLSFSTEGDELIVELGSPLAEKWAAILARNPPTLAEKLGIAGDRRAFMVGAVDDGELARALDGRMAAAIDGAACLIAPVESQSQLAHAVDLATAHPDIPLWCIHGKGRAAAVHEKDIRAAMRDAGHVDTKSCAVSERFTATRFARRAAR